MKKVTIYTTDYCGYCIAAKRVLENHEIPYEEIDVTDAHEKRKWLSEVTGHRTVPQIFIEDQPIGGYTDLCDLIKKNQLEAMLGIGKFA